MIIIAMFSIIESSIYGMDSEADPNDTKISTTITSKSTPDSFYARFTQNLNDKINPASDAKVNNTSQATQTTPSITTDSSTSQNQSLDLGTSVYNTVNAGLKTIYHAPGALAKTISPGYHGNFITGDTGSSVYAAGKAAWQAPGRALGRYTSVKPNADGSYNIITDPVNGSNAGIKTVYNRLSQNSLSSLRDGSADAKISQEANNTLTNISAQEPTSTVINSPEKPLDQEISTNLDTQIATQTQSNQQQQQPKVQTYVLISKLKSTPNIPENATSYNRSGENGAIKYFDKNLNEILPILKPEQQSQSAENDPALIKARADFKAQQQQYQAQVEEMNQIEAKQEQENIAREKQAVADKLQADQEKASRDAELAQIKAEQDAIEAQYSAEQQKLHEKAIAQKPTVQKTWTSSAQTAGLKDININVEGQVYYPTSIITGDGTLIEFPKNADGSPQKNNAGYYEVTLSNGTTIKIGAKGYGNYPETIVQSYPEKITTLIDGTSKPAGLKMRTIQPNYQTTDIYQDGTRIITLNHNASYPDEPIRTTNFPRNPNSKNLSYITHKYEYEDGSSEEVYADATSKKVPAPQNKFLAMITLW